MTTIAQRHGWLAERKAREWLVERFPSPSIILRLSMTERADFFVLSPLGRIWAEVKYGRKIDLSPVQRAFLVERACQGDTCYVLRYIESDDTIVDLRIR